MSYSYAHLLADCLKLAFVSLLYMDPGRPDMALYIFADSIINSRPIEVFNHGEMKRDFTFIDDIVTGVVAAHDNPPARADGPPYKIYNIGNNRSEPLMRLIGYWKERSAARRE